MVALGLVIEYPDESVARYAFLMNERLRHGFPSATVYSSLRVMAGNGLLQQTFEAPDGERSKDRFEARDEGIDTFERWIRTVSAPLELKDSLRGRLAFLSMARLPTYFEIIDLEIAKANTEYREAVRRVLLHEATADGSAESEFTAALLADEAGIWQSREKRLCRILEYMRTLGGVG